MARPNPYIAGLTGRCPKCGKGPLFDGYLKFAPRCSACGADFTMADTGDGASVFVMFLVGAIVVPLAFILQFSAHAPTWVTIAVDDIASMLIVPSGSWRSYVVSQILFSTVWLSPHSPTLSAPATSC